MLGEHEWCAGNLDRLQVELKELPEGDGDAARDFAAGLHGYVEVVRCHIEVEEALFFDTARHFLTESDRHQLTEEFEAVHYDEVEVGVHAYWEELAHRPAAAESQP